MRIKAWMSVRVRDGDGDGDGDSDSESLGESIRLEVEPYKLRFGVAVRGEVRSGETLDPILPLPYLPRVGAWQRMSL